MQWTGYQTGPKKLKQPQPPLPSPEKKSDSGERRSEVAEKIHRSCHIAGERHTTSLDITIMLAMSSGSLRSISKPQVLVIHCRDQSSGPRRLRTSEAAARSKLAEPRDHHPSRARRLIACEPHRCAGEIREVIWSSLVAVAILRCRSSLSPSVAGELLLWQINEK
ncbi:hypothetical protein TIFTF001_025671 [Ficus carica]|uniref:Uncharacterized protein n=1 Tax=Ficus carica TaxID=3494 RepID=A0AA88AX32_FICCA|nr:hypothetical protein TIFTF001_025671 [Ficus carica]